MIMSLCVFVLSLLVCGHVPYVVADTVPTCQPKDFHYEYTTCDSKGGRWRVSVPTPGKCTGGAPNPPIRGSECSFTCAEGQFLDVQGNQSCTTCPAGTYSLGGGVRYDDWTEMPRDFTVESSGFTVSDTDAMFVDESEEKEKAKLNCTNSEWRAAGEYAIMMPRQCSSTLVYATNLVRPGMIQFEYQHTDNMNFFKFSVQNEKCQSLGDKDANKWPKVTKSAQWGSVRATLKTGTNVLSWKVMNFGLDGGVTKPVFLRNIEISGIAYTSACAPCRAGTYSSGGKGMCDLCSENTFSDRKAESCQKCDEVTQYSPAGSSKCLEKPICTKDHYYAYTAPCDTNHQTRVEYRWIEPHICRTDMVGAINLPGPTPKKDCPACNLGMHLINGTGCRHCAHEEYSDGTKPCAKCPPSTSPKYGHDYKWWYQMPANMTADCLSTQGKCATKQAWIPSGDHIQSGQGKYHDSYLLLSLDVEGFHKAKDEKASGKLPEVGTVEFVFETHCEKECSFLFAIEGTDMDSLIEKAWLGNQKRQKYTYSVTGTHAVTFTWAFQQLTYSDRINMKDTEKLDPNLNFARIHSLKLTNTLDGAVMSCQACPRGVNSEGCVPCPSGHYVNGQTSQCVPCPAGTVVDPKQSWGVDSCKECGEGLVAHNGAECVSNCMYTSPAGRTYNFTALGKMTHAVEGSHLFTSAGAKYFHFFNISLCPGEKRPLVTCERNFTAELKDYLFTETVQAAICRATIIPEQTETATRLSAHPVTLGDHLTEIVVNNSMAEQYRTEGFEVTGIENDVHFVYKSDVSTSSCTAGRVTTITMRCDIRSDGNGTIVLPPKCPDGTCDGCRFHLLWHTMYACPMCVETDYSIIIGECVGGEQTLHYTPPTTCLANSSLPLQKIRPCSVIPFSLKIGLTVGASLGILMCIILVYCWKRNRRLEYKYMKLVQNTGGKEENELPAAETCALDEGEDEHDGLGETVHFSQSKGVKLLRKLIPKISSKDRDFEEYRLTEKESLT